MEPAINVKSLSLPKPDRRKLAQFFRKILLFFEKHGIVAVAAHGTLLGLVRNGDLLDHDDDLDMDIDEDNLRKLNELFVDGKCTIVDGPSKTIGVHENTEGPVLHSLQLQTSGSMAFHRFICAKDWCV